MTLGEKIKEARKQAGLSQEQLSEKLGVSRSAVAKWETDKGIPDVENLKALSSMLSVSIDFLLDNGESLEKSIVKEAIDLSKYKGNKRKKKDKVVREKYPNANICWLIPEIKLTKGEKIIDNLLGFLTDAPFGIPSLINQMKNKDKQYYLVEQEDKQFLVLVTDEFIESRLLVQKKYDKKFLIGNVNFTKSTVI